MMKTGDQFEVAYVVDERLYDGFIQLFNDKNPLHVDETFAREKGFESKVMHGAILNGFLSNFIGEQLPVKNVVVQSYKISFMKPVYMGTTLKLTAKITDVFDSVNCILFKFKFENSAAIAVAKGEISIGLI